MEEIDPAFPPVARRRFRLKRMLATGGTGRVWLAHDTEWEADVAVKAASFPSTEAAARVRGEFRAFAGIHHENVVRFHALIGDDRSCCYSMEFVDGQRFTQAIRGSRPPGDLLDEEGRRRLLDATWQLAAGVEAIHAAGVIHRDLKPDNVLLDRRGRVVILDPAIAPPARSLVDSMPDGLVGTMTYMAPEQLAGAPQGPPSDWFAVGVMLYEAIYGSPPHTGASAADWRRQTTPDAVNFAPLSARDPWVLAIRTLLHPDPSARGDGVALLRRLVTQGDATLVAPEALPFVGRDAELARLTAAWERPAGPRLVVVTGESGSGKSRLLDEWVTRLRRSRKVRVVSGTCDPRESVPLGGLDVLVDTLAPADRRSRPSAAASREGRGRAFEELRERLFTEALRRPVVVVLDDAQWAATDTLALLAVLARPPVPAEVLLLVGTRPGALLAPLADTAVADRITLGALPDEDARTLLGPHFPVEALEALLRAAGGHPLLLAEVCRGAGDGTAVELRALLRARIQSLSADERRVFELVVAAAAPLGITALRRAPVPRPLETVSGLVASRLLRFAPGPRGMELLPGHDAFGEAWFGAGHGPERLAAHAVLADMLVEAGDVRAELVAAHLALAGRQEEAAVRYLVAAREAVAAFAYSTAARAFERAFAASPARADTASRVEYAEVLAALGFGQRAGAEFLAVAGGETGDLDLRLRAAEQYLLTSRVPIGWKLLDGVLAALGVVVPRGRPALFLRIFWSHTRLAFGWLPPRPTPLLVRALWVAASALSPFDPLLSHYYGTLYALHARAGGDLSAQARAAALETILLARFRSTWFGAAAPARAAEALRLAALSPNPADIAYARVAEAAVHWSVCEAAPSIAASEDALRRYADIVSPTVHWEANIARLWLFAMYVLSEQNDRLVEMADHVERDAADRQDTWALDAGLFWAVSRAHLLRGRRDRAEAAVHAVLARSAHGVRNVGEVLADLAIADIALRSGDIGRAWASVVGGLARRAHHRAEIIPAIGVDYYFRRTTLAAAVLAGRGEVPPEQRDVARRFVPSDRRRIRALGGARFGAAVRELAVLHAEALDGAGRAPLAPRAEAIARRLDDLGMPFWAHLARSLPGAALGERDRSWHDGLYVDLYLPGLVAAG